MKSESLIDKYKKKREAVHGKYYPGGKRKPPTDKPVFPGKLSKLSDDELIDLMGQFAEWLAYASVEAGEADADRKFAENMYKKLKRERSDRLHEEIERDSKELKKYEFDTMVENDPEVKKMYEQFIYKESVYKMEDAHRAGFENLLFVLSRDLTRRLKSQEASVRREKMGYREDYDDPEDTELFDFGGIK